MKEPNNAQLESLRSIQDSPKATARFEVPNSQLTLDQPQAFPSPHSQNSSPRQQALKQANLTSSIKLKPVGTMKPEPPIMSPKKKDDSKDHFQKILDEMKEVRTNSENFLRKVVDGLSKAEQEPREKLKWKSMLETGQYIGSRGKETKDVRVSGRALSKEKVFHDIRTKINNLKYDLKNHKTVVKHLTNKPPNPAQLLQPQYNTVDLKPPGPVRDTFKPQGLSKAALSLSDFKQELVGLHFDVVDSPSAQGEDFMLTYNKEQLKKLKGGVNYMHKWKMKHQTKTGISSYRSEEGSVEYEKSAKKADSDEEETLEDRIRKVHASSPKTLESDIFKRKSMSKKQAIEERAQNLNPHEEFLRRLGFSNHGEQQKSKPSLFLTSEEVAALKDPFGKIDRLSENQSITFPGREETDTEFGRRSAPFFLSVKGASSTCKNMSSQQSQSDLMRVSYEGDSVMKEGVGYLSRASPRWNTGKKSIWSVQYQSVRPERKEIGNKLFYPPAKNKTEAEKQEIQMRYEHLTAECGNNARMSAEIWKTCEKKFNVIRGKLNLIKEMTGEDREIEQKIKEDIYAEIQNTKVSNPNYERKAHNKSSARDSNRK